MPTLAQLQAEPVWTREFTPPSIVALGKAVRAHFGLSAYDIGTKGDQHHLRGYHRSRAWVLGSKYSTNRTYSVTETPGNRTGGNDAWVCALDISAPPNILLPMCRRRGAIPTRRSSCSSPTSTRATTWDVSPSDGFSTDACGWAIRWRCAS